MSALLYSLVAEPLELAMRQEICIRGIKYDGNVEDEKCFNMLMIPQL